MMIKEKLQGQKSKSESTKAYHEDGEIRSSEEVFVMKMEPRDLPFIQIQIDNPKGMI